MIYCFCYVKDISADVLKEQVSEESYLDLNEEEDIRMKYSWDEYWRDVAEDGEYKSNIFALRWYVQRR